MSEIGSWTIEKNRDGACILFHQCAASRKSICVKLRTHDMWICRSCLMGAPDEISFAADLAPCRKSRPPLPRDQIEDSEFKRLLEQALRAKWGEKNNK